MPQSLKGPARFIGALALVLLLGSIVGGLSAKTLAPLTVIMALVTLVLLIKPRAEGWFSHRSVAAGALVSSLVLVSTVAGEFKGLASQTAEAVDRGSKDRASVSTAAASPSSASSAAGDLSDPTKQAVWIEVTKDAVRSRLKDPDSAQFRKVTFRVFQGTPMVCGQVNGKNSLGGYAGYQHFIGSGDKLVYLENDFQAGEFAKAWNKTCVG